MVKKLLYQCAKCANKVQTESNAVVKGTTNVQAMHQYKERGKRGWVWLCTNCWRKELAKEKE